MAELVLKRKKVKPDDFGGKEFWRALFRVGLIKEECPVCHVPAPVSMYKSRNWIPQTKCREHIGLSCLKTGFFAERKFKEPAAFVQYALAYTSRMSSENAQLMAGVSEKTASKFHRAIEEGMDEYIVQRIQAGDMLLGGDGKVVEIDEKQLTINKNHKGRLPSKKITIFGMVEVDAPVLPVEEVRLRAAVRMEKVRKAERMGRMTQTRRDLRRRVPDESPFAPSTAQMEVVEGQEEEPTVRPTGPSRTAEERRALAQCIDELSSRFDQAKNGRPKKALFYVEHKDRETLIPLIQRHVAPGSLVFTDEFATYACLRDLGYRHYAVCHTYEFTHYAIEGSYIIRVTTNHIERLWVEVARTLAHMTLEKTLQCLNLESYRQLRLYEEKDERNVVRLLSDLAEVWPALVQRGVIRPNFDEDEE